MGPMIWNNGDATTDLLEEAPPINDGVFPHEVSVILSALEAGRHGQGIGFTERRAVRRLPFRVTASMRLFVDTPTTPGRVIYTRDVNRRSMGFITRHRLPLGYGGLVEIPTEEGRTQSVHCTLLRCREAAPGWFEGSVYFNRDQHQFDEVR